MKKEKLSLKNIKNVLSKAEMKKIMAGSGGCGGVNDHCGSGWGIVAEAYAVDLEMLMVKGYVTGVNNITT